MTDSAMQTRLETVEVRLRSLEDRFDGYSIKIAQQLESIVKEHMAHAVDEAVTDKFLKETPKVVSWVTRYITTNSRSQFVFSRGFRVRGRLVSITIWRKHR